MLASGALSGCERAPGRSVCDAIEPVSKQHRSLPAGGCEVEVLDVSMLASGALSGCERAPGRSVCDAIEPVSKQHRSLPAGGCEVEVLDVSMLASGALSGCERAPGRSVCDAIEPVSKQMEAYCNSELGQQPYLPSFEELCIAKCGPNQQWYRAALCEQIGGPGGAAARVLLVDYGNLETVPVSALRKMLPEFVRGVPALAPQLEIQGWPTTHTKDMLQRALKHMRVTKEGRGVLKVTRCQQRMHGLYLVHAPELLEAMAADD
ncbi:uncharacterized protein LOC112057226 [Bicyclus anynana]|uniref:Uncharacterized protein LOC112057226 n=1 Tax=Bicyclus anynana TaxID=110368 RepID=A0ABM3M4R5_BICAN|nr:uncharacterized protein LOC112057226 [Bicyclus anynana]